MESRKSQFVAGSAKAAILSGMDVEAMVDLAAVYEGLAVNDKVFNPEAALAQSQLLMTLAVAIDTQQNQSNASG